MILKMKNIIQDYPWGSGEYLQSLMGLNVQGPLAELWMGVHPRGMSMIHTPEGELLPLGDYIGRNPLQSLGEAVNRDFGSLPYLFKLLAAGQALSIQAHPRKDQAQEGFARENAEGIPLDAFNRNYKDDNHKPEIICAITPYWAMKGFREAVSLEAHFRDWCPAAVYQKLFPKGVREEHEFFKTFFLSLMNLKEEEKEQSLSAALDWCRSQCPGGDSTGTPDTEESAASWVLRLNEKYPGDPGILAPLYLNTLCLKPGEALYLPAGELHAYLHGFGAELMANSDNVLRGGLTSKYMDLEELERVLLFSSSPAVPIKPQNRKTGVGRYETPSREFELLRLHPGELSESQALEVEQGGGPSILVVYEGSLHVREGDFSIELGGGQSCFLPAAGEARFIEGQGKAFLARVPL